MKMLKPVCRTNLHNKIVLLEVCRTFSGRGMGINGTARVCNMILYAMTTYVLAQDKGGPSKYGFLNN